MVLIRRRPGSSPPAAKPMPIGSWVHHPDVPGVCKLDATTFDVRGDRVAMILDAKGTRHAVLLAQLTLHTATVLRRRH